MHNAISLALDDVQLRALREAADWVEYELWEVCPKCHDDRGGFKMSCPPICVNCGWKSGIHPETLIECLREIAKQVGEK